MGKHNAQHSTAQHSTAQHSTAQHSTAQHSTAQHSTAQHSTAQHSTAQQNSINDIGKSYNELPYPSLTIAHSQPIRLHAIAKLKGLNPPDVRTAKILEIGCSFGGNLLPFAIQFPNSQIVGIDLSEHQIEIGKQMMAEIGIENIHLFAGDISQVNFENIQFDYIICHGVFSWVPENVQNAILACVQRYLSPNGIAYISYNTYPGWHFKEKIRNLMLFEAQNKPTQDKVPHALELVKFSANIMKRIGTIEGDLVQKQYNLLLEYPTSYIYHEYLEKYNQPFYFLEFAYKIKSHQLGYLSDTRHLDIKYSGIFTTQEYEAITQHCQSHLEKLEQYTDFVLNRQFRQSLISHQDNLSKLTQHIDYDDKVIKALYFKSFYINHKDNKGSAYWEDAHILKSTPLTDKICKIINQTQEAIQVKDLIAQLQDYPQHEVMPIVYTIIDNSNYLSFYPINIKNDNKNPYIFEKYRKLIQFIHNNPNITEVTDCYYSTGKLEYFAIYLSHYLDGKNSIDDLVQIVHNAINSEELSWQMELPPDVNKEQMIRNEIINTLNKFVECGFFNHYE